MKQKMVIKKKQNPNNNIPARLKEKQQRRRLEFGGIVSYTQRNQQHLGRPHRPRAFFQEGVILKGRIFYHPASTEKSKFPNMVILYIIRFKILS